MRQAHVDKRESAVPSPHEEKFAKRLDDLVGPLPLSLLRTGASHDLGGTPITVRLLTQRRSSASSSRRRWPPT